MRVLVTGGTSGLGEAMSAALLVAGADVVLTGRDGRRAAAKAGQLGSASAGRAIGIELDVRDEASVARGVAEAHDRLGGIDVLVNNAGIGMRTVNPDFMSRPQGFWNVPVEGFRDLFETNVIGYFLVARAVVPLMLTTGRGKVINVSVNEATTRRAGFVPYGPSRAATDAMSHVMAADLTGTGVTVNLLAPGGATRTGMTPDTADVETQVNWLDPIIMGPAVCWLASGQSDGITDARIVATEFS